MKRSNNRFLVACGFAAALTVFAVLWWLLRVQVATAQVQAAEAQAQFERAAAAQAAPRDTDNRIVIDDPIGEEGKESMLSAALKFLIQGPKPLPRPPLQPPAAVDEPAAGVAAPPGASGGGGNVERPPSSGGSGGGSGVPPGFSGGVGPSTGGSSSGSGSAGTGGGPPAVPGTGSSGGGSAPSGGFGVPSFPGTPGGPGMGPGGGGGMMGSGGGGSSISPLEQLRREYEAADRAALRLAQNLRDAGATVPSEQQLRELHVAVTNAFTARQRMLRAELAELQKQVRGLEGSIDSRDRAAGTIIGRRIEDLLNPNLRWDVPPSDAKEPRIFKTGSAPATGMPPGMQPSVRGRPQAGVRPLPLEGTWLAVQQGSNGELRPFKTTLTLTFRGDVYEFRQGPDKPYAHGTWQYPPQSKDAGHVAIDLTREFLEFTGDESPTRERRHVEQLIAAVEGDTLRTCSRFNSSGKNTNDFTTSPDDGRLLMVYRRVSDKSLSAAEFETLRKSLESDLLTPQPGESDAGKTGSGTRNVPLEGSNDLPEETLDLPGLPSRPVKPNSSPAGNVPAGGR